MVLGLALDLVHQSNLKVIIDKVGMRTKKVVM